MTNEQNKAHELADKATLCGAYEASHTDVRNACMKMAEWKDKQFAEEKQALIDRACEWLKENISLYVSIEYPDWYKSELLVEKEELITELKKAMEE